MKAVISSDMLIAMLATTAITAWSCTTMSMTVFLLLRLVCLSPGCSCSMSLFTCRNAMYDLRSELIVSPALNRPDQGLRFNGLHISSDQMPSFLALAQASLGTGSRSGSGDRKLLKRGAKNKKAASAHLDTTYGRT